MHVADRLQDAIDNTGSYACVGLDPRPELIPEVLRYDAVATHGDTAEAVAAAFIAFNEGILDAVSGHCAAVKPQAACYEAYGSAGWTALAETIRLARDRSIQVILDGKRNDMGSTADHYRQMLFGGAPSLGGRALDGLGADWATINGYLGTDCIDAFLPPGTAPGSHGIFVLVRTSNPSASDLQDQPSGPDGTVSDRMAELVAAWGRKRLGRCGLSDVGAVVGANWPTQARDLRVLMADTLFLVPGYGAQGGGAEDAVAGARPKDGRGIIVSSSRGIIGAWQQHNAAGATVDWADAARHALDEMNSDLAGALS